MGREIFIIVFFGVILLGTIVIARNCLWISASAKAWMNHVANNFGALILVYCPKRKKVGFLSDSVKWKFDIDRERVRRDVKYLFEALHIPLGDELVRNFCEGDYPLSEQKEYTVEEARKQGLHRVSVKTMPCDKGWYLLTIVDRTDDYMRSEKLKTVVKMLAYENQGQMFQKVFDEIPGIFQKPGDIFAIAVKQLSTRLTEFVRADQPLAKEIFPLRDMIWEVIEQLSYQTKAVGQKLELNVSLRDEMVIGDKEMLRLVMWNIIENAIAYTPEDGTIVLTVISVNRSSGLSKNERQEVLRRQSHLFTSEESQSDSSLRDSSVPGDADSLVIVVEDTGVGIGKEFMKKLFQPLQREDDPVVRKMNGYGLGLATVKKIVDSMGGKIEIKSEKGKGTRFAVRVDINLAEEDETK